MVETVGIEVKTGEAAPPEELNLRFIYGSFDGRVTRKVFWLYLILPQFVLGFVIGITGVLGLVFYLLVLIPSLAVTVKRWHDVDKSGWWILINLVPIFGMIYAFIVNGLVPGTDGPNRFGAKPIVE